MSVNIRGRFSAVKESQQWQDKLEKYWWIFRLFPNLAMEAPVGYWPFMWLTPHNGFIAFHTGSDLCEIRTGEGERLFQLEIKLNCFTWSMNLGWGGPCQFVQRNLSGGTSKAHCMCGTKPGLWFDRSSRMDCTTSAWRWGALRKTDFLHKKNPLLYRMKA